MQICKLDPSSIALRCCICWGEHKQEPKHPRINKMKNSWLGIYFSAPLNLLPVYCLKETCMFSSFNTSGLGAIDFHVSLIKTGHGLVGWRQRHSTAGIQKAHTSCARNLVRFSVGNGTYKPGLLVSLTGK